MRALQDRPAVLEAAYELVFRLLWPFRRLLHRGGLTERVFVESERLAKGLLFDCRMCGQCVLHQTGMTCPMTCPKEMRNGPCGGVRLDGTCEVIAGMPCPWLLAWKRAELMPRHGGEIESILPPLDRRRVGTSAWINDLALQPAMGDGLTSPSAMGIFHGTASSASEAAVRTPSGRR